MPVNQELLGHVTARPDVFGGKPIVRDMRISADGGTRLGPAFPGGIEAASAFPANLETKETPMKDVRRWWRSRWRIGCGYSGPMPCTESNASCPSPS